MNKHRIIFKVDGLTVLNHSPLMLYKMILLMQGQGLREGAEFSCEIVAEHNGDEVRVLVSRETVSYQTDEEEGDEEQD